MEERRQSVVERPPFTSHERACLRTKGYAVSGKLLGKGAYSKVYLASALDDSKQSLACKVTDLNAFEEKKRKRNVQRLTDEKDILANLKHPNIITYFGSFLFDGQGFEATDTANARKVVHFMEKGDCDLLHWIHSLKGGLSLPITRRYLSQMVAAIRFIHGKGYVHRDLKPANFIVTRDRLSVKLTDFNLAQKVPLDSEGIPLPSIASFGTPNCMAPEVLRNRMGQRVHYNMYAADVWSLGATLYVMVTSKTPFDKGRGPTTDTTRLERQVQFCSEPLKCVSNSNLKELMEAMFCLDFNERKDIEWIANHPWIRVKAL